MHIVDLDGNTHNWHLTGHMAHGKINHRSTLHIRARHLISTAYPTLQVLEEVSILLRKNQTLYLDFYLPLKKICYEVHGEQHYKFVPFYHNNMLTFLKAQDRDRDKEEWCLHNNIKHIVLSYEEPDDIWYERIKNA